MNYKLRPAFNADLHKKNEWVIEKLIQLYGMSALLRIASTKLAPGKIRDKCLDLAEEIAKF